MVCGGSVLMCHHTRYWILTNLLYPCTMFTKCIGKLNTGISCLKTKNSKRQNEIKSKKIYYLDMRIQEFQLFTDSHVVRRRILIRWRWWHCQHREHLPSGDIPQVVLQVFTVYIQIIVVQVVTETTVQKYLELPVKRIKVELSNFIREFTSIWSWCNPCWGRVSKTISRILPNFPVRLSLWDPAW